MPANGAGSAPQQGEIDKSPSLNLEPSHVNQFQTHQDDTVVESVWCTCSPDQEQSVQLGPTQPIETPTQLQTQEPINAQVQNPDVNPADTELGNLQTDTAETQSVDAAPFSGILKAFNSKDTMLPNILLIGGVLLMVLLMMRMLKKNTKANARRANIQGTPAERIEQLHTRAQTSMEPSTKLMVDAEEMARRLGAILDNKAARLELLIEEADTKLNSLNRAVAGSSSLKPTQQSHDSKPQAPRTIDPSLLDRARVEQDLEDRQSRVAGRIEPAPHQEHKPQPVVNTIEPLTIQAQIIQLAQTGLTNIEIAHELKQPIGQVELVLNLNKQRGHG